MRTRVSDIWRTTALTTPRIVGKMQRRRLEYATRLGDDQNVCAEDDK